MPHPTALFALNLMQYQTRLQITRMKYIGNVFELSGVAFHLIPTLWWDFVNPLAKQLIGLSCFVTPITNIDSLFDLTCHVISTECHWLDQAGRV